MLLRVEDFVITETKNSITIRSDPAAIRAVRLLLSCLGDLASYLENRTLLVEARRKASDEQDRKRRRRQFEEKARTVFGIYSKHLNNGCNGDKQAALTKTRTELGMLAVDAKVYVQEGRRLVSSMRIKQ